MTYEQALTKAQLKSGEQGVNVDPDKLDTNRQRKKFAKGYGIVRKLAGLSYGKNAK